MTSRFGPAFLVLLLLRAAAFAQFGSSDPFESRLKTKPSFQIKFRVPEKGGEVRLTTKNPVHYEKDVFWEGSGEVTIEYQDVKITADRARYDFPTKTATLEGHVVIDQGPTRLSGSRGVFRVEDKTGRLENATADLAPTYHIVAESIEKIGEATYRIEKGIFTSCDLPKPEWSFYLSQADVTLDDYARMKNVSFRAGPVPVLYTPYLVWPTKQDRASGFLVPGAGYNSRRGGYLGLSYYWVTGRATDSTTQLDLYSRGAIGVGEEFRWTPTPESAGIVAGYAIRDPDATVCVPIEEEPGGGDACTTVDGRVGVFARREKTRWKARLDHVSDDLPFGFRGVLSVREYSDEQFLRDFERAFALSSSRQTLSRGFLTKNFGDDSVNLRVERSETFFGTKVVQERLPSLEYSRRTSRIGRSPFFLAFESSFSYLYVNRGPGLPRGEYGRADVHPTLSIPWKTVPWLSVTARGGGRWTEYSDSTDDARTSFSGDGFSRTYGEAGVSLVGPSFSRIYEGEIGRFGKFKHVIEPRADYEYVSDVKDPLRIPVFDEVDTALGRNQVRYAIVNRLLARPVETKAGGATEIASFEIAQTHAFRLPQLASQTSTSFESFAEKTGPIEGALRVAPGSLFSLDGHVAYDTHVERITAVSFATSINWKTNYVNATWFGSQPAPPAGSTVSARTDQIRVSAGVDLGKALRVDTQLNYDARENRLLEDRSLLTFNGSCYALFLEVRQLRLPPDTRRDYRFVVNLKDVGQLLDVNGSLDRIFGGR
ncbi:MAG TPA: LPS assembly protein LptD [Thermoanaerobaculia bacterium]|nr:LPS assembly protein LptD [Thermoanaerobaculia bacterium]